MDSLGAQSPSVDFSVASTMDISGSLLLGGSGDVKSTIDADRRSVDMKAVAQFRRTSMVHKVFGLVGTSSEEEDSDSDDGGGESRLGESLTARSDECRVPTSHHLHP